MSITLNRLEYFDKILHTHWHWRHLVQEIAKWHLSLVEALPSSKFWKSENSRISWTEWNTLINFCITIDITRSSLRDCKMTFFFGRGFAELQILKRWKWPYLWKWVEYCDEILHTHWYWQVVRMRLSNDIWDWLTFFRGSKSKKREVVAKWHLSSVEALPSAKFWKSENGFTYWTL